MEKTMVMKMLEKKNINYISHTFNAKEFVSGVMLANSIGVEPERMFKTLVTTANTGEHLVFCIPVSQTLNLKKCAKIAGVKGVEMLAQKDLLPLTGYVHGGCSPIGMKKQFRTFIDETAILFDKIVFSAGKIGNQVEMNPNDIFALIDIVFGDLT